MHYEIKTNIHWMPFKQLKQTHQKCETRPRLESGLARRSESLSPWPIGWEKEKDVDRWIERENLKLLWDFDSGFAIWSSNSQETEFQSLADLKSRSLDYTVYTNEQIKDGLAM